MKALAIVAAVLMLWTAAARAADPAPGKLKGGIVYTLPDWFKPSFLDFRSDVEEARKQDKHVMVFLHLDECPYCARMLKESFVSGDDRTFMQKHFDVIGVNVQGSLEVTWIDGATYTERALARHLKTFATPTIVFVDLDGRKVLQLTGYRDPRALRDALEYVQSKRYREQAFTEYVAARTNPVVYDFLPNPQFSNVSYFKGYAEPLLVLFEDRQCGECARFHEKTLNHPDVVPELKKFLVVRLDAESTQPLVDIEGRMTTPAKWVKDLGLTYRPSLIMFNDGREIYRADGRLYHFHFQEALRYVSGAYYKQFDTLGQYKAAYRAELRKKGIDVDYSE